MELSLTLNNRYRLLSQVAAGGMAVVYKAQDTLLNRVVAVKVLRESFAADPTFQARFQREAQSAANLTHPNIVTVYDVGQDTGRHYIVMEFVDGEDLKHIIRGEAPLAVQRAVDITVQMCAALGAAHRVGLVHCDVKPQNVLVTQDGRVKVTDFGIARLVSQASTHITDTVWGTPHYISPEQATGQSPTPASDVYAVGCVLYEMLAGRLPFEGETHTQLALAHMRDEPPPLTSLNPAVPPYLEQIVRKVMSKEPAARYRSADQLATILLEYRHVADQATGLQPVTHTPIEHTVTRPVIRETQVRQPESEGFDWLGWLLGGLAAIALIGLIPLWLIVLRTYTSPAVLPTPSPPPFVTPSPSSGAAPTANEPVDVPNVIGVRRDEAVQRLTAAGLTVSEDPRRFNKDAPKDTVIEQNPAGGTSLARDAIVRIVVSDGPQVSPVVNILNLIYDDTIREGLKQFGWDVRVVEIYSPEPVGQILDQMPTPLTPLAAGDPLTLTVSGGITITLETQFDGMIQLDSALLPSDRIQRGEPLDFTLLWHSLRTPDTPYTRFVHLVDPSGVIRSQIDAEPNPPTSGWTRNFVIRDQPFPTLDIPLEAPPGEYKLYVGFYPVGRPANRLSITDAGKSEETDNQRALIKTITILP